jgi:hypothetical protein
MSTCNCDGSVNISLYETIFGDKVINSLGINESSFGITGGVADPRPIACSQAVGQLRATAQDPCNLDSPGDLQVYYSTFIQSVWATELGTPVTNPLQKAADVATGTATPQTPVVSGSPSQPQSTNWTLILGFVAVLAIGFILILRR